MKKKGLKFWIQPGWSDEVRQIPQGAAFREILSDGIYPFRGRCLNAGCGEGLYDSLLRSLPGIESVVNMDLQEKTAGGLADYVPGSLTQLPFPDQSFDCCLASEVLEHIPDDHKAVSEIARVLRPDGMLLISVPALPAPHDPNHVREGYTIGSLAVLLEQNGFTVRRHIFCLFFLMRIFYMLWQWQFETLGGKRRSWLPRFIGLGFGHADKVLRLGKPWDLVMLAQKAGS